MSPSRAVTSRLSVALLLGVMTGQLISIVNCKPSLIDQETTASIFDNEGFDEDETWQAKSTTTTQIPQTNETTTTYEPEREWMIRAQPGEFPWHVSLYRNESQSTQPAEPGVHPWCAGVIINPYNVLTSARCVDNQTIYDFKVLAGQRILIGEQDLAMEYKIAKMIIHPRYDSYHGRNDLAILKMKKPIKYRETIGEAGAINEIKLPDTNKPNIKLNEYGIASGFNYIDHELPNGPSELIEVEKVTYPPGYSIYPLYHLNLRVIECTKHEYMYQFICVIDKPGLMIYGPDSGAGFVKEIGKGKFELVALGSHRNWRKSHRTRITLYVDWINDHL